MRESNNLVVTNLGSSNNNLMSKFESSIKDDNSKKSDSLKHTERNETKEIDTNLLKSKTESEILYKDEQPENRVSTNSVNDNEAQFLMLANKFNEAVEVILELSEKVEKLERLTKKRSSKRQGKNFFLMFFNLKIFAFLVIIPIIILGFFTLPFDFAIIKSIISDIISII